MWTLECKLHEIDPNESEIKLNELPEHFLQAKLD